MFEKLGVVITVVGLCSADSDNVVVPLVIVAIGLLTAWVGGNRDAWR